MAFVKTTLQTLVAALAQAAEVTANKLTVWQSVPNNIRFPSEKLVKDSLDAISVPTLPRVAYIDAAYTGNIFPYFNTWAAARAALLALTPAPDSTHPCWAVRFSAADGTQISLGGDTAVSLAAMGILLRDGLNGADGADGVDGAPGLAGNGASYRYIADISQGNPPTVNGIILNTFLGTIAWTKSGIEAGMYVATLNNAFPSRYRTNFSFVEGLNPYMGFFKMEWSTTSQIYLYTYNTSGTLANIDFSKCRVMIEVYP